MTFQDALLLARPEVFLAASTLVLLVWGAFRGDKAMGEVSIGASLAPLIEAKTYRFYNHHGVQNLGLKYRSDEEVAVWKLRDPIFTFEDRMIENGVATRANFDDIWAELRADIDTAIQFAEDSPYPTPDQITVNVYTSMTGAI